MSILDTVPSRPAASDSPFARSDDDATRLPPGMTCGDCARMSRCDRLFGGVRGDTVCGFTRNRFRPSRPAS